jgi:dihydrofolate synthase/folylpolyglutamate synthase
MPNAYACLKEKLLLPSMIHIVGTNGKGSTGRFLALMLQRCGKRVGHYTSPHILRFNERIWVDGAPLEDADLEALHGTLQSMLPPLVAESLSYFEYTTFLAALAFASCDYAIMEAGLGGEWDATNVFDKTLSIVTPIGMDHQAFLGDTLEAIAGTKLRSIRTTTVLSHPQEACVREIAMKEAASKEVALVDPTLLINASTQHALEAYLMRHQYPNFFYHNLQSAYGAARILNEKPCLDTLPALDLRARAEAFAPNVLLDCGHNVMAARALVATLKGNEYVLIYNSYRDKDIEAIVAVLAPKIAKVLLMPLRVDTRALGTEQIKTVLKKHGIVHGEFNGTLHANESYVVFGSFAVVEAFLEKTNAK